MKNIKNFKFILIALSLLFCLLINNGCASSTNLAKIDKQNATKINTIEAYEDYIKKWPNTAFVIEAKERIAALNQDQQWQKTNSIGTFSSYENFLKQYPLSPHTKEAFKNLNLCYIHEKEIQDSINWQYAVQEDNIEAYERFLINNPSSKFIGETRKRMAEIGTNSYFDSIRIADRQQNLSNFYTKKRDKTFHPIIIIPVLSKDDTTRVIVKNQDYIYEDHVYEDFRTFGGMKLRKDFELLDLRFSKPYDACVLFISRIAASNIEKFNEELEDIFHSLIISITKYLQVSNDLQLILQSPVLLIPKSQLAKTFQENLIRIAKIDAISDLTLNVKKPQTIYDTDAFKLLVKDLSEMLQNPQADTSYRAVKELLYFDNHYARDFLITADSLVVCGLIAALNDKELKEKSISVLIDIGEPVIPQLIPELKNEGGRLPIINILTKIHDSRAIDPLVEMLIEWDIGPIVANALKSFDWLPESEKEIIFNAVAKRNKKALLEDWLKTREVLLSEITSYKRQRIKGALYAFIAIGKEEIIPQLIEKLNKHGNKTMAETYLNCGHSRLTSAARTWAYEHGYRVMQGSGAHEVNWGSFK